MYYEAVGLFLEEYCSMDSMRSIAYTEALGMSSAKLMPFSYEK